MPSRSKLICLNIVLTTIFVALILGCGGDPADPPPGSIEEKLCGKWGSDPIPSLAENRAGQFTTIVIDMSYWNFGLLAHVPNELTIPSRVDSSTLKGEYLALGFTITGMTATSEPRKSADGSTWIFRVDATQPDVMYATWILNNSTERLHEVRFRKEKK